MERVFLIGCEAEYLRDLVGGEDEEDFCSRGRGEDSEDSSAPIFGLKSSGDADGSFDGESRAGSLVVHIRSGDIFKPDREGWHGMIWYGQVRRRLLTGA